jgi:hypothetical protein
MKRFLIMVLVCSAQLVVVASAAARGVYQSGAPVDALLNRLRTTGICVKDVPRRWVHHCISRETKSVAIWSYPERRHAKVEAIKTVVTVASDDPRIPRQRTAQSQRVALRLVHELLPDWSRGPAWVKQALMKARTHECLMVTHFKGYTISVAQAPAFDFNLMSADLVISRSDVFKKYRDDPCSEDRNIYY